jgi:hypothetical protein
MTRVVSVQRGLLLGFLDSCEIGRDVDARSRAPRPVMASRQGQGLAIPQMEISARPPCHSADQVGADPTAEGVCKSVADRGYAWADTGHAVR